MLPTDQIIEMPELSTRPQPRYRPFGHIIQLDWTPPEMIGTLHLPDSAKKKMLMEFYRVQVLEVGPDVKMVKKGDWVLLPAQPILSARWDGHVAYFTSEDRIVAVVDMPAPAAQAEPGTPFDETFGTPGSADGPGDAGSSAQ